uniref:E3 ubiquitin-protein ligase RNF8-A n=2 Tax=Cacopsylla melanoneura TaxID=428564 RepID=A0A8D9FAR2_9HEMI
MKNYLAESNEKLKSCYEHKIEALYGTKLDLEKQIEARLNEKNTESETIINQLSNELDSVRELLTIHENERQVLESEVQSKIADFAEVLESEAQCTICSEIFINAVTLLGCMHTFCEFCITEWKKQKLECPICRHKIAKNQEKRNILIDSWIASFIDKMSPAIKANRQEVIKIRAQQAQIPINSSRPRPSSSAASSRTAAPVVASTGISAAAQVFHALQLQNNAHQGVDVVLQALQNHGDRLAVLHQAVQNHEVRAPRVRATRRPRVNQRARGPGTEVSTAGTAANNSVIVVTNRRPDPVIVNQDPIYVGQPLPVVPRNANPIVISDEE